MLNMLLFCCSILTMGVGYAQDILDIEKLAQQIKQVEENKQLAENEKKYYLDILQETIHHIEAIKNFETQVSRYKNSFDQAPKRQAELQKKLIDVQEIVLPNRLENASLIQLESAYTQAKIELSNKQKIQAEFNVKYNQEKSFDIQAAIDEARDQYQAKKDAISNTETNALLIQENQRLKLAELRSARSKIDALEQQLLSREVRQNLVEAELKLVEKEIFFQEAYVLKLQNLINGHRQNDAERDNKQAQKTYEALPPGNNDIIRIAQQNIEFSTALKTLMQQYDPVLILLEDVAQEIKQLQQRYLSLTQQLTITQLGSSPAFGVALRQQKDKLAELDKLLAEIEQQEILLTKTRLNQFKVDLAYDGEIQRKLSSIIIQSPENAALYPENIVEDIISQREKLLKKLSVSYAKHIDNISQVIAQLYVLKTQKEAYADLLDQQLLWIPDASSVDLNTIQKAGNQFLYIVQSNLTLKWLADSFNLLRNNSLQLLAIGLLIIGLLLLRLYGNRYVQEIQKRIGKVNQDSFYLTLSALIINVGQALVVPAMIMLGYFGLPDESYVVKILLQVAMFYWIFSFLTHSLRADGLAESHFKWPISIITVLKNKARWFSILFVPLFFLILITEQSNDLAIRENLGRIVYIMVVLWVVVLTCRIAYQMHQNSQAIGISENNKFGIQYIVYVLFALVPGALALLAILGYYYTALHLTYYLTYTLGIIVFGIYTYYLAYRLFSIRERRLALNRARAKRAAHSADSEHKETAETIGDNIHFSVDEQSIDLQTISEHTTTVLKILVITAVGLGLGQLWSEIFTAFQWLDSILLWNVVEMVDGQPITQALTLWDLILTLIVGIVTILAAKNLPGLMEIAVLSRLSLATGTDYAVTTILRYIIVISGSITVLQLLGAEWSKLQWLVAALGVGLGFGLQEIVANFVSGILILFERPIRIGDTVTVGDQFGTVSRIRIRATTITDWDRREVIIPNKTFITERLVNWTLSDPITRTIIKVGVAYGSDVALVERCLVNVAEQHAKVISEPPPAVLFHSFGDSSLNFQLRVFVRGMHDLNPVIHGLHIAIDKIFREQGIEIAFPQQDINFGKKPLTVQWADSAVKQSH